MEALERLSSSVAQVELLVTSLKRENRDLGARLAAAASERRQALDQAAQQVEALRRELEEARQTLRHDPGLEQRAHQAELESAELARQLDAAQRGHLEEKSRFEGLVRQLEAQVLATRSEEQMPVASAEALAEAQEGRQAALEAQQGAQAALALAEERERVLEAELRGLRGKLDQAADAETGSAQEAEALKTRLAEQDKRITALESHSLELERQLGEAQLKLAESAKPEEVAAWQQRLRELEALSLRAGAVQDLSDKVEAERNELKRQRRELAAFAKDRQVLHRRLAELVSTLESVRLG